MKTKIALSLLAFSASCAIAEVKIISGAAIAKNKRPYQEDRFTHVIDIGGEFFGVYDGHGGADVSTLLSRNLQRYFANNTGSTQEKLQCAFDQADYESQNLWPDEGSTALVVFVDKHDTLHGAWCGDTRAVLECNGKVCFATNDHKPDRKDEKERIERAGGKIYKHGVWRVNGLAVSRSIGDKACKVQGVGQIIATPEYAQKQLTSDNHFLIMATDGLWDVMGNEEVVALVRRAMQQKKNCTSIAVILRDLAIEKGSNDNITVCVVKFDWQPRSLVRRLWNWLIGT